MTQTEPAATRPQVHRDFADLISPISLDQFFSDYWSRKPLYLGGRPDRLGDIFARQTFMQMLPGCRVLKAGFYDQKGWYCDLPITPAQVARLWEANMTICAGHLPADPRLEALANAYRRAVSFPGEVYFNSYMSPDGEGFTLHIDDHPVFILQIEGAKRWWISRTIGVQDPVRGFSFPPDRDVLKAPWGTFQRPDETEFLELTLEPGDLLYLPAGTWHKARAIGFSLGLTMASRALTPLDLAQRAVTGSLERFPVLTRQFWGGNVRAESDHALPKAYRKHFEEAALALRSWSEELDAESLYRLWRQAAQAATKD